MNPDGMLFIFWICLCCLDGVAPLSAGLHGDPRYGHAQLDFTFIDLLHKRHRRSPPRVGLGGDRFVDTVLPVMDWEDTGLLTPSCQ